MNLQINDELNQLVVTLKQNILDSLQARKAITGKYLHAQITPSIYEELKQEYQEVGKDYPILYPAATLQQIEYNRDIKFPKDLTKTHTLIKYHQYKDKLYAMDYPYFDTYLKNTTEFGYYNETIELPQINDNGVKWMTPVMFEYKTMQPVIDKSFGHVLTFGLGIGFFQYQCLLRDEVIEMTIVERSPEVIELFKKYILPQFKTTKPIHIIEGDMYDYYNDTFLANYDFVFTDVWLNNGDGLPIYCKLIGRNLSHPEQHYWIEREFINNIRMQIAHYLIMHYTSRLNEVLVVHPTMSLQCVSKALHKMLRQDDTIVAKAEDFLYYINDMAFIKEVIKAASVYMEEYNIME